MSAAANRLTSKGQVTIPVAVRRRLGLKPGDAVRFTEKDGATVIEREADDVVDFQRWIDSIAGTLDLSGKTTDEWLDDIRPYRHDPV